MSAARKRPGLGRGLEALLEDEPVRSLPLDRLHPNRYQPRSDFDDEGLEELARSIEAQGLVQPIVVTPDGSGSFTIVAGERRWRAARRAGLAEVPVVVREIADDRELLELALVENLQRSDLNPVEEAEAFQTLAERFDLSQAEIAGRVGKARSTVANALRLLNLPEEVRDALRAGRLTAGQARPLLAVDDRTAQLALAREAIERDLTAREIERRAAGIGEEELRDEGRGPGGRRPSRRARKEPEVFAAAAEEKLTRRWQTKVEIRRRGAGGTVRIHFHSEEELMRLYDQLMERGETR